MSSKLEHFSHPQHPLILKPLILKEDDVITEGGVPVCYVCDRTIINALTYACTSPDIDIDCENFYLHKSCAELPTDINHHKHKKHTLTLRLRLNCKCDVCGRAVKSLAYACRDCDFDVCIICSFEQRLLHHVAHQYHSLTLMQREALFECDACGEEAKDSSYVCTTCDFWIHRRCAMAPFMILTTTYHQHPLNLVYSIPDMYLYFDRYCAICAYRVNKNNWVYYCHKCAYFVHVRCATINENGAYDTVDTFNLVQLPPRSEYPILELIKSICGQFQVDFQGDGEKNITASTIYNDPHIIEEHWSHNHPLEKFQFADSSKDEDEDNSVDIRVIICDGCIQPITTSDPSYYACVQCAFFLHSLCATKLPKEFPAGASTFHSKHPLFLKKDKFSSFVKCGVCSSPTNGFYYSCESCDIKVDIRCAFLPNKILHKSHKEHFLVLRPSAKSSICSVSTLPIFEGMEYACETCNKFQINVLSAFYPSSIKHKYDNHPITLRHPPFFYEGEFHCEICEEQVDQHSWLYHCVECDYSFHCGCVRQYENVKLGGTIKLSINDENHTLALVFKRPQGKNSPLYICCYCEREYKYEFFFECDGCGFLACCNCVNKILGE